MAKITDRRIEELLRSTMVAEEAALPVTLRPEDILRRRTLVRRERVRRSGWRLLLVAAMLAVPLAGLLAIAGTQTMPPPTPATYRAVVLQGAATEPDAVLTSDLEVLLVDPDGHQESVASIPLSVFPPGMTPAADGWLTHTGSLGVSAYQGSTGGYATFDLHDLDAAPVLGVVDPRPVPDALPALSDPLSKRYGELRVCRFTGTARRRPCEDRTDRAVESGHAGDLRAWLPRAPEGVTYDGAAWAAGDGMWVLQDDRRDDRRALSLVHVDPDGTVTPGGSFGLEAGTDVYLAGIAPDDSLAVLQSLDESGDVVLVEPRTGLGRRIPGAFLGFADPTVSEVLPRIAAPVEVSESLPRSVTPAYRQLESLEDQVARLPGLSVVFTHEGSSDGPVLDYDTGMVPFLDVVAVSIECTGPGSLTAMYLDGLGRETAGSDMACLSSRGDSHLQLEAEESDEEPSSFSVKVRTEGQVHWRLVAVGSPLATPGPMATTDADP